MIDRLERWDEDAVERERMADHVAHLFGRRAQEDDLCAGVLRDHREHAEQARRVLRAMAGSLAEGGGYD